MTPHPLACEDVEPLLPLIADGAIAAADEPAAFAHLAACERCQEQLALHDLVELALTAAAPARPVRPRRRVLRLRLPWAAALAASLAAILAVGWAVQADRRAGMADRTLAERGGPAPSDTEVLTVPGPRPGTVVYVIRRGDQVVVVDPQQQAPARDETGVPVGLRRY